MTYTYLLAGENLELAEAELEGFLKSQRIDEEAKREGGRLAETDSHPGQLKRLALTHEVAEKITETKLELLEIDYTPENSFAVRVENLSEEEIDSKNLEKRIGHEIESENNTVDLENPNTVVKAYVTDKKVIIGEIVEDIDRGLFSKRENQKRPFSSPISLDPVLARAMTNLSEVSAGEKLLDPFCGTGGLLIEAGLCGVGVYGLDIQKDMVKGSQENLEEYGILSHDIRQGDIAELGEVFEQSFDAVVTDLPYGKASVEEKKPVRKFMKFLESFDGKAVFMYNKPSIGSYDADYSVYVHKSLTRYIYVL